MTWSQSYHARILIPVFAGVTLLITPSFPAQAASEQRCAQYARGAVADYRQLRNIPECSKRIPQDTARWQPHYDNHYNWCRQAETAWLTSETKKRDELLLSCGGRGKM